MARSWVEARRQEIHCGGEGDGNKKVDVGGLAIVHVGGVQDVGGLAIVPPVSLKHCS